LEVTILLCDYAESVNGKLYIAGGGWTNFRGSQPINCAVGILLSIPWTETNQPHVFSLELVHEDGQTVMDTESKPIKVEGKFEAGRPPGSVPGDALASTMAYGFHGLDLPSGGYRFALSIDGVEEGAARFRVYRP
jgi:hypothetical protein